ncbi:MAG: MFS transporter, partial [Lachnospiraceae bacterium]|nr:MFS transporter [Lachnospiraceae bacterium]
MYKKDKARKQIQKLLVLDGACGFMIAGASWVTLLAARGFTTIEIGLAESIFHTASMLFEIPSGAIADVFGRKKVLFASRIAAILSSLLMILSDSFFMIGIAMVISALSYNLASGTREALAYDTLKQADIEKEYNRFAANDMVIYQISSSLATLLAGVALMLGYRR